MAGQEDRRDREEATRLFVAAVVAFILLVAMGVAGLYYFVAVLG